MHEPMVIIFASILVLTLACQWFAWWVRLPSILFLLIAGLIVGPIAGWLNPDVVFGNMLEPCISLAVAIILFEGSLSLNFREIKPHLSAVSRLLTLGVAITSIGAAVVVHDLFHVTYQLALLFGVIVSVSGPTTITPLLRAMRPSQRIANILRWEGIIIDPIGALLSVLVFNFITIYHVGGHVSAILLTFFFHILVGVVVGLGLGYFIGALLRRHLLPEYLHNVATLAIVILAYTLANQFDSGSGLLAVTVMGILLANMRDVHIDDIIDFKESLSLILISAVFIVLAARIDFHHMRHVFLLSLILLAALQFIIRPVNVFLCTVGTKLTWKEKALLAWIAPRGIVAAAVSAIFALRLDQMQIDGSRLLVVLVFLVVIGTVVFQSLTAPSLAKWLGLSRVDEGGYLIIGANPVACAIAKALEKYDVDVLLVSVVWDNIQAARMLGLNAYYGHPVSDKTDRQLDLLGLDHLLAITARHDLNSLSCVRYNREFGARNIFSVKTQTSPDDGAVAAKKRVKTLFGDGVVFQKLLSLINQGAQIKHTTLTEEFTYGDYQKQHPQALQLFAVTPKQKIRFFTDEGSVSPKKEWTIVSLVP